MHDIEMAIDQGKETADLSLEEEKIADVANLELRLVRLSDQVCSRGSTGGILKSVVEFNAFLERAASILENR